MIDVEERVRHQAFVAAAITGAGSAVVAMRFLIPSLSHMMYLVAGLAMSLGGSAWHVAIKRRPPAWQLLGVGAAAAAAAAAVIWLVAPRPGNLPLAPARLPDLLISLPRSGTDLDFAGELFNDKGDVETTAPDGLQVSVMVAWRTGALPAAGDVAAIREILGAEHADDVAAIDDPGLSLAQEHHSYSVRTRGMDGLVTTFACLRHFYVVLTLGNGETALHRRIVDSAECGKGR
jgi:hypothetical protein